jgi:hypothetical protein
MWWMAPRETFTAGARSPSSGAKNASSAIRIVLSTIPPPLLTSATIRSSSASPSGVGVRPHPEVDFGGNLAGTRKASVADLADHFGIGPRHLLRLFLQHAAP